MVDLMDFLLSRRRSIGNNALMLEAARALISTLALTAYPMASELMLSNGPYEADERRHLDHLALMCCTTAWLCVPSFNPTEAG